MRRVNFIATIARVRTLGLAIVCAAATAFAEPRQDEAKRSGLTFELNAGLGYMHFTCAEQFGCATDAPVVSGLDAGFGEWITNRGAAGFRFSAASFYRDRRTNTLAFIGGIFQQWIGPRFWLGGGLGGAVFHGSNTNVGFAFDVRAGFVLHTSVLHSWNLSIEATPAFSGGDTATVVSFLVGYQRL